MTRNTSSSWAVSRGDVLLALIAIHLAARAVASLRQTRSCGRAHDRRRGELTVRFRISPIWSVFLPLLGMAADSVWHRSISAAIIERTNMSLLHSKATLLAAIGLLSVAAIGAANAQSAEIQLSYKDKKFDPAEIGAPANTPIVIKLRNLDAKPMEFESKTLHIEKVVAGSSDATINVRAQKPGRYEFVDEYNEKTARGALVVK
jgi:hypothetical protein